MAVRPRDSQKGKFWNWKESHIIGSPTTPYLIASGDIERIFTEACVRYNIKTPKFHQRKLNATRFSYKGNNFTYYPASISAENLAIAISWHRLYLCHPTEAWHGAQFCAYFAQTFSEWTGIPVTDIHESMKRARLKVFGTTTVKTSAQMLKRYNLVQQRVAEIEQSIRLAREEFEDFLRPVLDEHKKISSEMDELKLKLGL